MKQKLSTKYKLLAAIGIIFITFATSCSFSNNINKSGNTTQEPNNGSISEVKPSTGNSNTTQEPNNSSSTDSKPNDSNNTTE